MSKNVPEKYGYGTGLLAASCSIFQIFSGSGMSCLRKTLRIFKNRVRASSASVPSTTAIVSSVSANERENFLSFGVLGGFFKCWLLKRRKAFNPCIGKTSGENAGTGKCMGERMRTRLPSSLHDPEFPFTKNLDPYFSFQKYRRPTER